MGRSRASNRGARIGVAAAVLAGALLLAAAPAAAQLRVRPELLEGHRRTVVPPPGLGFVSALAAYRIVPQADFVAALARINHVVASRAFGGPAGLLPLAYRVDAEWTAEFTLGYGTDRFLFSDQTELSIQTATITIGGQRGFDVGIPWLEPYVGFGIGWWLSSVSDTSPERVGQASSDRHTTAGYVSAGLRVALTPDLGLVLEDRFAYAEIPMPGLGIAQVGGNSAALGLYYVWRH